MNILEGTYYSGWFKSFITMSGLVWPVQSDGEKMENGCSAAENITGGPHVTEERTKYPGAADLKHPGEIHKHK